MHRRVDLANGEEDVEVADDVVDLRVDGVRAIDHRVRSRSLFPEVDNGFGHERAERRGEELVLGEVANRVCDAPTGQVTPHRRPPVEIGDRHETRRPKFLVVVAAHKIVDRHDVVSTR